MEECSIGNSMGMYPASNGEVSALKASLSSFRSDEVPEYPASNGELSSFRSIQHGSTGEIPQHWNVPMQGIAWDDDDRQWSQPKTCFYAVEFSQHPGPTWPQAGPKTDQVGPKTAQDGPRSAPRWPKIAPKRPKIAQDRPKVAKDGSRLPKMVSSSA